MRTVLVVDAGGNPHRVEELMSGVVEGVARPTTADDSCEAIARLVPRGCPPAMCLRPWGVAASARGSALAWMTAARCRAPRPRAGTVGRVRRAPVMSGLRRNRRGLDRRHILRDLA